MTTEMGLMVNEVEAHNSALSADEVWYIVDNHSRKQNGKLRNNYIGLYMHLVRQQVSNTRANLNYGESIRTEGMKYFVDSTRIFLQNLTKLSQIVDFANHTLA